MKESNDVLKLVDRVKKAMEEKEAKGDDFVRNTQKFKHFSESEKSLLKNSIESSWKRGEIKDKQLGRLMLKSLGSSMDTE